MITSGKNSISTQDSMRTKTELGFIVFASAIVTALVDLAVLFERTLSSQEFTNS
jgi:hypothetical protein